MGSQARRANSTSDVSAQTVITFLLKTNIAGHHPGVIQIQGRLGTSYHEVGGYGGVLLYEGSPGEVGGANHIASAIYEEETRLRQSSTLHDARFDFSSPCFLSFFQKNEAETEEGKSTRKREIGSLSLSGGQSREQICQAIADTIVSGWEKPPETAYSLPEYLTSEHGTIIYGHDGHKISPLIAIAYNGHMLEGPLLFHAWSQGCIRFATLHLASEAPEELRLCYHLCSLLEMDQGWLFCDNGIHPMDEPLTIVDRTMPKTPWYYSVSQASNFPVIRDKEKLTWYSAWRSPVADPLENLPHILHGATPGHSLFCPECRRSWLWEADDRELQALSESASLPTLCPHYFYCSVCQKWSGPPTPAVVYERSSCQHERPALLEKRLALQDYRTASSWHQRSIHIPPVPFVRDIPSQGMFEYEVLFTFLTSWVEPGKGRTIPAGTRLVGIWDSKQSESLDQYRIFIQDERWVLPATHVSACCFLSSKAPRRKQFEIAQESLQAVESMEATKNPSEIGETLERALLELSLSDALPADLASPTFRYAHLLLEMGKQEHARKTMERAADYFRYAVATPSPTDSPKHLSERKILAIKALMALGNVYIQQGMPPDELITVAKQLKSYEDDLKRLLPTYREKLIEMRLFTALLYALANDIKEATYLYRLVETLFKNDPRDDRERYEKLITRVRAVLYPEAALLLQMQKAQADIRRVSLEQVKEAEKALFSQKRSWSDQQFLIYLRVRRYDQTLGMLTLEESVPGYSSQKMRNSSRFRVEDLVRQGASASAALLAEDIYSDLASRNGKYSWDKALDFKQETTIVLFLSVEAETRSDEARAARYALFAFNKCVLPSGTPRTKALNKLSEGLVEGLHILDQIAASPSQDASWMARDEGVPQEDLPLLSRIRRYGFPRPYAGGYRDYAREVLGWVRTHLFSGDGDGERDCYFWRGEVQISLGSLSIELIPREIVWALSYDSELPLTSELWPQCGHAHCICPSHQLEVISITGATKELATRGTGAENARYAIEDGIRSGALPTRSEQSGEIVFARSDFDTWRTSPAFAEHYISGKNLPAKSLSLASKKGLIGQERVQSSLEGAEEHRQAAVMEVWAVQWAREASEESLRIWVRQIHEHSSARFVWSSLSAKERCVLWTVIEENSPAGSSRLTILRRTGLIPDELDATLGRLQFLLLLQVDYLLEEEIQQYIGYYKESEEALRTTGAEFFSTEDRSHLSLAGHFDSLSASDLISFASRYAIAFSRTSSDAVLRRMLTEKLIHDPRRMFAELSRLDFSLQRLVGCVYEHGGWQPLEDILSATGIERSDLTPLVQITSTLGFLFDRFAPGGKRVLFIPSDVYEVSKRLSITPRTLWQLNHFLEPAFVRDGQPAFLYDLVIFLWHVYHSTIEPTQDNRIPVRMVKKIVPSLHILPREEEGIDWRVELIDFLAWSWGLVKKSTFAEEKPHYLPGERLPLWAKCDLPTQARLAFIWWLGSPEWTDLIAADCKTRDIVQQHKDARTTLVLALQTLKPEQWYPTTSFLNILWERSISSKSSGSSMRSRASASSPDPAYERWARADGLFYTSMLASTVHELGLVALGYHQHPETTEACLHPDLLQLTELGKAVLSSKLTRLPSGGNSQDHEERHFLIVQPNFEMVLLHPNMQIIWRVLPFVEVQQIERVSKMRLTKTTLHHGIEQGQSIDDIIEVLRNLSQKELPQNILYTLRDWASKHLSAQMSRVVLIEVPNEYVAHILCSLNGFQDLGIRQIAPCFFAVLDSTRLLDVRRFLLQNGISPRILE